MCFPAPPSISGRSKRCELNFASEFILEDFGRGHTYSAQAAMGEGVTYFQQSPPMNFPLTLVDQKIDVVSAEDRQ